MTDAQKIAKQFRELYFGGNWTWVNLKDSLEGITVKQANKKVNGFNSIAVLVYHMSYYVTIQLRVLKGKSLRGTDQDSFNGPPVRTKKDWDTLLKKTWKEAREYAALVDALPDKKLDEIFIEEKYGTWYRNLHGLIEHAHYHLGQIVLLKKLSMKSTEKKKH